MGATLQESHREKLKGTKSSYEDFYDERIYDDNILDEVFGSRLAGTGERRKHKIKARPHQTQNVSTTLSPIYERSVVTKIYNKNK